MKTIIHDTLSLEMPVALKGISMLEINQRINDHSSARIEGTIRDEDVEAFRNISWNDNFSIIYENGQADILVFSGIPVDIKIKYDGQAYISMTLSTRSILMDYEKKTRSFQRKEKTYKALFRDMVREHGGDILDYASNQSILDIPLIQYEETDWEFLLRATSYLGAPIYPGTAGEKLQILIGFGGQKSTYSGGSNRVLKKRIAEYLEFRNGISSLMEHDFLSIAIDGEWDMRLGSSITYEGKEFLVTEIYDNYHGGLWKRKCILKLSKGIKRNKLYQEKMRGASLEGTIKAVEADRVRIKLDVDKNAQGEKLHWYPWHKNDWFCMPEVGSKVRLSIPGTDETKAYAADIYRTDGKKNSKTRKPDNKCFVTKRGKGFEVTPKSLTFRASGKKISIQMSDRQGIKVKSSKGIKIQAGETFLCEGDSINISSKERIALITDRNCIVIDDLLQIKG